MGLGGSRQGNVALDLNDRAVERKLAQGARHGVAIELQLLAHLGQRRCIEAGFVQQGNDAFAGLAHHTRRSGSGVRVEHLGTLGGTHAARAALGNQGCGNCIVSGGPSSMGDGTGRKARLLGGSGVHDGQGRRQRTHRGIERGSICIQRAIRASKRASSALRHQLAQRRLSLTGNKIERRSNIGSRNRRRPPCPQHLRPQAPRTARAPPQ